MSRSHVIVNKVYYYARLFFDGFVMVTGQGHRLEGMLM